MQITQEFLEKLGQEWLEQKIQRMKNLMKIAEPDEAIYREIMISLGYPKNKVQFLELALMLPFREIRKLKYKDVIENALLYRAGFTDLDEKLPNHFDRSLRMQKSVWDFAKIRPANRPDKRIKGISELLEQSSQKGIAKLFYERIMNENKNIQTPKDAKEYVNKIMEFKGLGSDRKKEMFFNVILPFAIAVDKNNRVTVFLKKIFQLHPPLSENSIIKKFFYQNPEYRKMIRSTETFFGAHLYMKNLSDS
ncbi:MAG: DUF2851 family protein [Candidatus Calescibacterium sp.]|nr:DUF2851 family protein [Candidatus Calescibacterium sp.]MCX7734089.1 DUF2851 family protein [bacterium]MDW8087087.1 DUF2851 family protein [Candidatus Calescibacterium sp.]